VILAGESVSVLFGLGGSFSGDVIFGLAWSSVLHGCCEMDKKFLVESKSFAFFVLARVSALRVEEKRKNFLGVVILNCQSSEWLASMLEVLLGLPEEQEIVKSFKNSDCSKRWEQRWTLFRGFFIRVGWSERVHCYPRGSWRVGLDQIL